MLGRMRRKGDPLHGWWECELVQPLWKTVWRFLRELKIELSYDPAIALLGIYPKDTDAVKWEDNSKVIVDLAEQLQDCGIAALTIHGRTRAQMYTGEADWTLIGEVKNNPRMHIPIIGNGDVTSPQRCKECFDRYGVDGVMIGRASFGRPWIFKEVKHYLQTGEELPSLSFEWCMDVLRQEVIDSVNLLDERRGILHVRRHLAASPIFKGIPNFRNTRIAMLRAETQEELFRIFDEIHARYPFQPEAE